VLALFVAGAVAGTPELPGNGSPCQGGGTCSTTATCKGEKKIGACAGVDVVCCIPQESPSVGLQRCVKNAMSIAPPTLKDTLISSCQKVRKQSKVVCTSSTSKKIQEIRKAVTKKCLISPAFIEQSNVISRAKQRVQQAHGMSHTRLSARAQARHDAAVAARHAAAEKGDGDDPLHPKGVFGRVADWLINKAAGTTAAQAAAGCDFQISTSCRAWITDCADSCLGEAMAGCKTCMGAHFDQCCPCDTVRQFGIASCNY